MSPRLRARIDILLAATLWSLSAAIVRLFQQPTPLGLDAPRLEPLQLAFWRSFFAGLVLVPLLAPVRREVRLRPSMLGMMLAFAAMNACYLSAVALGSAAEAILLQNLAPVFIVALAALFLRQVPSRATVLSLLVALIGLGVMVVGNSALRGEGPHDPRPIPLALASAFFYGIIILALRHLRDEPAVWLTVLNQLGASLILLGVMAILTGDAWAFLGPPTPAQLLGLALFGIVQMGLPYWLFARGLRHVSPQEAGLLALLEPILNPVWAWLIAPETDTPTWPTLVGGVLLLGALAARLRAGTES